MPSINTTTLLNDMGAAALAVVGARWGSMEDFARDELSKIAATARQIELDKANGRITEDEARTLLEMRENALRTVWLGMQGMAEATLQDVVNAVMGVVKGAINRATGFALL